MLYIQCFLSNYRVTLKLIQDQKCGTNQILRKNQTVKCLELNTRSLVSVRKANYGETVSNLERFQNFVYTEDIDIVFVNETWLSHSINSADILHAGYTIVRNDREGRRGGVLLEIRTEYLNPYVKLNIITI